MGKNNNNNNNTEWILYFQLVKKLENSERIRAIVSKENEKLKFEKNVSVIHLHYFFWKRSLRKSVGIRKSK